MSDKVAWTNTMGTLYEELKTIRMKHNLSNQGFPAGSNYLERFLKRYETDLKNQGITFEKYAQRRAGQMISLKNSNSVEPIIL